MVTRGALQQVQNFDITTGGRGKWAGFVIYFSVKIQNIFKLIVNIIILRSKPQGVIEYAKHLNLNHTVCLWSNHWKYNLDHLTFALVSVKFLNETFIFVYTRQITKRLPNIHERTHIFNKMRPRQQHSFTRIVAFVAVTLFYCRFWGCLNKWRVRKMGEKKKGEKKTGEGFF
jgi:hypothetical protein